LFSRGDRASTDLTPSLECDSCALQQILIARLMSDTLFYFTHEHPQMDYGYFNTFIGRPVDKDFWGTRTEHIVGVAAALAVTDHASQNIVSKFFLGGKPLSFATAPAAFVAHTFFFIFTGVTAYVAADAAFNPYHTGEGRRMQEFKSGTYSSAIGSCTAWYEPYVSPALARVAGPAIAGSWFGSSLLPATLAYSTVSRPTPLPSMLFCQRSFSHTLLVVY
jgi:hypothetical protein